MPALADRLLPSNGDCGAESRAQNTATALDEHRRGLLWMTTGVVLIIPEGTLLKLVHATGFTTALWRMVLTSFALALILVVLYGRRFPAMIYALGFWGIVVSVLQGCGNLLYICAMKHTTVANVVLIISTGPFWAALMSRVVLGNEVRPRTWLAMPIVFSGIAMSVSGDPSSGGGGFDLGQFLALGTTILGSARRTGGTDGGPPKRSRRLQRHWRHRRRPVEAFQAVTSAAAKLAPAKGPSRRSRRSKRHRQDRRPWRSPVETVGAVETAPANAHRDGRGGRDGIGGIVGAGGTGEGIDMLPAAFLANLLVSVVLALSGASTRLHPGDIIPMTLLGFVFIPVAQALVTIGSQLLPSAESCLIFCLETVFSPLLAALVIGDPVSPWSYAGLAVVVTAIACHAVWPENVKQANGESNAKANAGVVHAVPDA